MEIMVILAAIVAALLVGPAVAVGAVIDSRKVRDLAGLLRSRLETLGGELGSALWRAAEAERKLAHLEDFRAFWREKFEEASGQAESLAEELMAEKERSSDYALELVALLAENDELREEVASLRKQRSYLVGQRDMLASSAKALTADAEGAAVEIRSLRGGIEHWMVSHAEAAKRARKAEKRIKALEAFINRAYGPVDECEIGAARVCAWCETLDIAGGSACEVCDQPF